MAIEAERLLAIFEARFSNLEKGLDRVRGDAQKTFDFMKKKGTEAEDALAGVGKRSLPNLNKQMRVTRFETANVAAQFQDIGVQLAGGTSPFLIAMQQGTQLNQILGPAGLRGSASLLGGAFLSLLNPVSLATIGIIGLGGALVQYVFNGGEKISNLNQGLQDHADFIRKVEGAYGDAIVGLRNYAQESATVFKVIAEARLSEEIATLRQEADELKTAIGEAINIEEFGGAGAFRASEAYSVLRREIDALHDSAVDGEPDIRGFRQRIAELAESNPTNQAIQNLVHVLVDASKEALSAETAFQETKRAISGLGQIAAGQVSGIKEFRAALNEMANIALPQLSELEQANQAYRKAIEAATSPMDVRFADAEYSAALERIEAAEKAAAEERANRGGGRSSRISEAERERQAVADLIAQLEFERTLIGMTDLEREQANALRQAGAAATDEQRQKIEQLTAEIFNEKAAMEAQQQALRDLENIGKTAMNSLATAFADGKLEASEMIQIVIRLTEQLLTMKSLTSGAGGGGGGILGFLGSIFGGGSQLSIARSGGIGLYANGTNFAPGGLAIVGERGPELVNLPRGSRVHSNPETKAILSSGTALSQGVHVTVGVAVDKEGSIRAFVQDIAQSETGKLAKDVPNMAINSVQNARKRRIL